MNIRLIHLNNHWRLSRLSRTHREINDSALKPSFARLTRSSINKFRQKLHEERVVVLKYGGGMFVQEKLHNSDTAYTMPMPTPTFAQSYDRENSPNRACTTFHLANRPVDQSLKILSVPSCFICVWNTVFAPRSLIPNAYARNRAVIKRETTVKRTGNRVLCRVQGDGEFSRSGIWLLHG